MSTRHHPGNLSLIKRARLGALVGVLIFMSGGIAEAHSVFLENFIIQINDVELLEFDAHAEDENGNPVPIELSVAFEGSTKIIIQDNIGCKADVGVASSSSFINVTPNASEGPVVRQEFQVSAIEGGAGQHDLPLVIGWTGDGETIVLPDGSEVVCDESHQAHFRVTLDPDAGDGFTNEDLDDRDSLENANGNDNSNAGNDNAANDSEGGDTSGASNANDNTSAPPGPEIRNPFCAPGMLMPLLLTVLGFVGIRLGRSSSRCS